MGEAFNIFLSIASLLTTDAYRIPVGLIIAMVKSPSKTFLYVTHKSEVDRRVPFRKVVVGEHDTVGDLLMGIFHIYNVPFAHLKVYYNNVRIDSKKLSLKLKKAIFDKNFCYGVMDDVKDNGKQQRDASCLEVQSFFELSAYQKGGKAYPYIGANGEIMSKPDPGKLPSCWKRYIEVSKKSMSVRIIMWMWAKSYVTRLILIISTLFLIQSFFVYDTAVERSDL